MSFVLLFNYKWLRMERGKQDLKRAAKNRGHSLCRLLRGAPRRPSAQALAPNALKSPRFGKISGPAAVQAELGALLQPELLFQDLSQHSRLLPVKGQGPLGADSCLQAPALLRNSPGYQGNVLSTISSETRWLFDAEHTPLRGFCRFPSLSESPPAPGNRAARVRGIRQWVRGKWETQRANSPLPSVSFPLKGSGAKIIPETSQPEEFGKGDPVSQ